MARAKTKDVYRSVSKIIFCPVIFAYNLQQTVSLNIKRMGTNTRVIKRALTPLEFQKSVFWGSI